MLGRGMRVFVVVLTRFGGYVLSSFERAGAFECRFGPQALSPRPAHSATPPERRRARGPASEVGNEGL